MRAVGCMFFFITACCHFLAAQQVSVDKVKFFEDTSVVKATLSLNFKKLLSKVDEEGLIFPATFSCKLNEELTVTDNIAVEVRGHFRRGECYLPPLKLIYKNNRQAAFYSLKALKLVSSCRISELDDQNLLKEYLTYKIYNLICDKSFRVRLLNLTYLDSGKTKKPITQHAFLIEDIKELAKRNACADWTDKKFNTESTDRAQMTKVAIFEYMIGNTDWSVPVNHNIKIIQSLTDSSSMPFVVPYDFDFSGLVNTNYSAPDERLAITDVKQRLYRGFSRSEEELNEAIAVFNKAKEDIYTTINNCDLLWPATKKYMIKYLQEFYKMINRPGEVKHTFIANARKE